MKKIILTLTTIFICTIAYAHTINWHVGDTILETTTCDSGDSITPPTAPYKYGYHFVEWKLPYTPIEYLESTGTQYIDTGYKTNSEKIKYKWKAIDTTGYGGSSLFGAQAHGCSCLLYGSKDVRAWYAGVNSGGTSYKQTGNEAINWELICDNGKGILNKESTIIDSFLYSSSISIDTIYIFASHKNGGVGEVSTMKLYSFQIYDNDVLVRDMIPVLDGDGVLCMYDKVEHKFYYNAGTGQFIAGPVIGE